VTTGETGGRTSPSTNSSLREWDRDTLLRDGSVARLRPIRPTDRAAWRAFYSRLSEQSIQLRFLGAHSSPTDAEVEHFVVVDYLDRMAFVVEQRGEIIGIGRYDRADTMSAEIAFAVDDAFQGRGIGTLLLEYLVGYAYSRGIRRFVADTMAHNVAMLSVFRRAGFAQESSTEWGVTRVSLDLSLTPAVQERVDADAWRASVASLRSIMAPTSIAVIGASRSGTGVGIEILRNLLNGGYQGQLFAVNPAAEPHSSDGASWYRTIAECPIRVSLAIVAVPSSLVLGTVDQCAEAGVAGLIIVTSGFAEAGAEGASLQAEILDRAHRGGLRIIGPNCIGVINTAPGASMNASFAAQTTIHGHLALGSQSGALGIALLEETRRLDIGVSSFVSMGNQADIGSHELLRYWHQDASTRVILLYLEALTDPPKFFEVARIVTRTKPIVVMKSGRSVVGARAAASHTAALASSDRAADALFAQAGVIRAKTLDEMLALGTFLDHSPIPEGPRVAIIANAGGAGVLAADTADEMNLEVVPLRSETQRALRGLDPDAAAVDNPVDLGSGATAEVYQAALGILARSGEVDVIVAIHADVPRLSTDDFVSLASEVAWREGLPTVAVTLGVDSHGHADVARFAFPESAVRALAQAVRYGQARLSDPGTFPELAGVERDVAKSMVERIVHESGGGRWLDPDETSRLFESYGLPVIEFAYAHSASEAASAAREIGFPVAVKADALGVLHKLDAGGVAVGLTSADAVRKTVRRFREAFGSKLRGVIVQKMSTPGVELIIGAVRDPAFGPLVLFGSGGTNAELFRDQVTRLAPLTVTEADELVHAPRGARLLEGFRGEPPSDIGAVIDVLHRISRLTADIPEVAEVECNPLIALPEGANIVDARVRLVRVEHGVPSWIPSVRSGRPG
jgi:acyl-CoA synthetase (NDP forming)/RimJ/RimL family protein N-acetyltransferase